jgi:hypothetical protein
MAVSLAKTQECVVPYEEREPCRDKMALSGNIGITSHHQTQLQRQQGAEISFSLSDLIYSHFCSF